MADHASLNDVFDIKSDRSSQAEVESDVKDEDLVKEIESENKMLIKTERTEILAVVSEHTELSTSNHYQTLKNA